MLSLAEQLENHEISKTLKTIRKAVSFKVEGMSEHHKTLQQNFLKEIDSFKDTLISMNPKVFPDKLLTDTSDYLSVPTTDEDPSYHDVSGKLKDYLSTSGRESTHLDEAYSIVKDSLQSIFKSIEFELHED